MAILTATILWAIALLSVYIYQNANHEVIKMLAAAIAVVCIIWGFAATHWGLHLLCLLWLMRYKFSPKFSAIAIDD
ncbi:MAG: hypothetical protein WBB82_04105 [Limnothrix sp.]